MEKLSHEERLKVARYIGVTKAFIDAGYPMESVKTAMLNSMPEGMEKEAFIGWLGRAGRWLIQGARASRAARMGAKAIKPGAKSFNTWEGIRRGVGMDLTRLSKRPGKGVWEMGKGIVGNMLFPGMIKSKSTLGQGIGTGLFVKSMAGPMFSGGGGGGPTGPQQYRPQFGY